MHSGCKRIINGILWEMSELITQERIAVGSSNLVEGLITAPSQFSVYVLWPNGWMDEDGIRDAQESRGLGDVYKRQVWPCVKDHTALCACAKSRQPGTLP